MNSVHQPSEKGQAIVYLVLGIVVFFGFVALAIDGGMVLADRRNAQNASDAASLAGGAAAGVYLKSQQPNSCEYAWSCGTNLVFYAEEAAESRAVERAGTNNFSIDEDLSDHNGVATSCADGDYEYIDVTVEISATTQSNFLQLVYPNALHNEVEAVTRVYPGGPLAFGNAIVALNSEVCSDPGSQGVIVGGSSTIAVSGGNVFSNGCLRQNGDKMTVVITDGVALGHELFNIRPDNWESPEPTTTGDSVLPSDYEIDQPSCSTAPAGHNIQGKDFPNILDEGLWCVTGDVTINQNDSVKSSGGVTIVMLTGKFTINGPADVNLTAPDSSHADSTGTALYGILLYVPATNSSPVLLNGNQTSVISGLIYAPKSAVTLTGTGGNTYDPSQVIAWDVELTGNSELYLNYDSCSLYLRPPSIELHR